MKRFSKLTVLVLIFLLVFFTGRAQEKISPFVMTTKTVVQNQQVSNAYRRIDLPPKKKDNTALSPKGGISFVSYTPIYSMSLCGELIFHDRNGLFKVVAHTDKGKELLIYRDLGKFHRLDEKIRLQDIAFETALYTETIDHIEIVADGCSFTLERVTEGEEKNALRSATDALNRKMQFARFKEAHLMANRINEYNKKNNIPWVADVSRFSLCSYQDKKSFWQVSSLEEEKMTFGWEYYRGGILVPSTEDLYKYVDFIDEGTGKYVESFDWRNRHGKNWNTPCEDQMNEVTSLSANKNSYSCWVQGPKSLLESYIKRHTGDPNRNERLSSQQIISCSGGIAGSDEAKEHNRFYELKDSIRGGWTSKAVIYIRDYGVMSWDDLPFKYIYYPCLEVPRNPHKRFKPVRWSNRFNLDIGETDSKKSRNALMSSLIKHGPISITHRKGKGGHVMLLSGWTVVKSGPFLPSWEANPIQIEENHPLAGKVAWIFKNSVGEDWGYNGYAYLARNKRSSHCPTSIPDSILPLVSLEKPYIFTRGLQYFEDGKEKPLEGICVDEDGDGYYRWGLIGRPNNPDIPLEMDGDDSNPALGPMDEYGFCRELKKVDLYMRDTPQDKGVEPNDSGRDMWESPDIWIRNDANSTSEEHENPEAGKRAYIHIRIHNKGTQPSNRDARVFVYWAKAGLYLRRTTFEGKEKLYNPETKEHCPAGGFIRSVAIPSIPAGGSTIVTIPWDLPDYKKYKKLTESPWHYCLLAEIMNPSESYYSTDSKELGSYVSRNNNVAQKNLTIINTDWNGEILFPIGNLIEGAVTIHNGTSKLSNLRVEMVDEENDSPITQEAEVSFKLNPTLAKACLNTPTEGLRLLTDEAKLVATASLSKLSDIRLAPGETGILNVKFNFLTKKMSDKEQYTYKVRLIDQETNKVVGGETYVVRKAPRTPFYATIIDNQDGKLRVHEIGEVATYKWVNREGKVVAEGKEVETKKLLSNNAITLEVEAKKDGFKDYTSMKQENTEEKSSLVLAPIPVQNDLEIRYPAEQIARLQIVITDMIQGTQETRVVSGGWNTYRLDISTLPAGNYTLTLQQEGNILATRNFTKQ